MQTSHHVSYVFLQRWEATSVTIVLYFHGWGTRGAGKNNLERVMIGLLVSPSPPWNRLYNFFRRGGLLNNVRCALCLSKGGQEQF